MAIKNTENPMAFQPMLPLATRTIMEGNRRKLVRYNLKMQQRFHLHTFFTTFLALRQIKESLEPLLGRGNLSC